MTGTHFIIGTRPEATKGWLLIRTLIQTNDAEFAVIFTGQHRGLLAETINDLSPIDSSQLHWLAQSPDPNGWQSYFRAELRRFWNTMRPQRVCVLGDTDSVRISAEIANELTIPVVHIEAGIRHRQAQEPLEPEERNRRLVSKLASLHLAPNQEAIDNLVAEGISRSVIRHSGDFSFCAITAAFGGYVERLIGRNDEQVQPPQQPFVLCTFHRSTSVQHQAALQREFITTAQQSADFRFLVVSRPDTRWAPFYSAVNALANVSVLKAMPPSIFLAYLLQSDCVLTDSAGVQQEALILGKSVVACRANIELHADDPRMNVVAPAFTTLSSIVGEVLRAIHHNERADPVISSVRVEGERIAREAARQILRQGVG